MLQVNSYHVFVEEKRRPLDHIQPCSKEKDGDRLSTCTADGSLKRSNGGAEFQRAQLLYLHDSRSLEDSKLMTQPFPEMKKVLSLAENTSWQVKVRCALVLDRTELHCGTRSSSMRSSSMLKPDGRLDDQTTYSEKKQVSCHASF